MKSLATIPQTPKTWSVIRLKFCLKPGQEGSKIGPFGSELRLGDLEDQGIPVFGQANVMSRDYSFGKRFLNEQRFNELKQYVVKPDDVLITMMGSAGRCDVVPEDSRPGIIDSHLLRLRLRQTLDPLYLRWFIDQTKSAAAQAELAARGSIMAGLNSAIVRDLWCPLPPLPTQHAIVSWLDVKTAAIDALIEKKRRLVQLLAEKRAALINQAVTKGLDPTLPMKNSGIPWIGEIPAHWTVTTLRRLLRTIEQGWSPQCDGTPVVGDEWGVLKSGCTADGLFNAEANKSLPTHLEPRAELEVKEGDVLVSRASGSPDIIGSAAIVPKIMKRLMLSDKIFRLRIYSQKVHSPFLVQALGSRGARAQIVNMISGAEGLANNLPQGRLKDLVLVAPPFNEQVAISKTLCASLDRLAEVKDAAAKQISRLQEYRQALITAAVTGQLEIPVDERVPEEALT